MHLQIINRDSEGRQSMVVNSLNDLSITIHEIGKRYNIQNYIDEFKTSLTSEVNPKFWEEFETLRYSSGSEVVNPLEKIMLLSSVITDEELEKVSKINKRLEQKYAYSDFVKECESARQAFLRERKTYFSMKVAKKHSDDSGNGGLGTYFDITGMTDVMLAEWLDSMLEKIYPNHLDIEYEDMNGKRVKTKISHRVCVVGKDFVEAPLIDRYHGSNAYDQFYLHSVYDTKKRKWVYLPMRLIISVKSDEIDIDGLDVT
jgi:uncharacterized protein (DUF2344 family)